MSFRVLGDVVVGATENVLLCQGDRNTYRGQVSLQSGRGEVLVAHPARREPKNLGARGPLPWRGWWVARVLRLESVGVWPPRLWVQHRLVQDLALISIPLHRPCLCAFPLTVSVGLLPGVPGWT